MLTLIPRDVPAEQVDRLPPGLQLCGQHVAFLDLLRLLDDPQAPGLGAGAGPRDESIEGQGSLWRVAEPLRNHRRPQGQDRSAGSRGLVEVRRTWTGSLRAGARIGKLSGELARCGKGAGRVVG
jgi:hypothetical protein